MPRTRSHRDLSVDEIVERAREILEREGARGLSMRRVAKECGVTPMALYHHVADKQALEDLVVDRVIAEAFEPAPDLGGDWRTELVELFRRYRAALLANPGAAAIYTSRPILTPSTAWMTELMFALMTAGGLEGRVTAEATDALMLLVFGSIVNDLTRPPRIRDRLAGIITPEQTPFLSRHLDAYSDRDPEERFLRAVSWVLDGAVARSAVQR